MKRRWRLHRSTFIILRSAVGLPGFVGPVPPPLVMSFLFTSTCDYSIAVCGLQTEPRDEARCAIMPEDTVEASMLVFSTSSTK